MSITELLFWILAIVSLFSALMVVISKNPVYSVLWLIITFFSISGHYILLNAQFLAVVNIIVYAGAIMVLVLFEISSILFLSAMVGAVVLGKRDEKSPIEKEIRKVEEPKEAMNIS